MSAIIRILKSIRMFAAVLLLTAVGTGAGQALDSAKIGYAEVVLEQPPGGAIQGEMVLLKFRAVIHGISALDELHQPALADLDWKQLGRDRTFDAMYNGFSARGYERDIAVYPQRSGKITIDPFVYHLTMIDENNKRVEMDLTSAPVSLEVRPLPATAAATGWLPAKSVTVKDSWDKPPDHLAFGETARRTVTIEAEGIGAERLPAPPLMRAPGVISFAGPVERTTRLTPQGPVARAVYQWDIRPMSRDAAVLPAFPIHWFDTVNRYSREAVIPEQRISLASASAFRKAVPAYMKLSGWHLAGMGLGSLIWGLAALYMLRTFRSDTNDRKRQAADLAPLRAAARANEAVAFRNALSALSRSDPRIARIRAEHGPVDRQIAALDAGLFGQSAQQPSALMPLYRQIAALLPAAGITTARRADGLAPLDGPLPTVNRSFFAKFVSAPRAKKRS